MTKLLIISPRNEGCNFVHTDYHRLPLQLSEQPALLWAISVGKVEP